MRHPIIMSSTAVRAPFTQDGKTFMPDMGRLSNKYGLWSIITEIRFYISMVSDNDEFASSNLGAAFSAKFTMGSFGITNQFVSLPAFCTQMEVADESAAGVYQAYGSQTTGSYSALRWKLPKPLLVPPLSPIQCVFRKDQSTGSEFAEYDPQLRVAYLGEQLDKGFVPPKMAPVPYVSYSDPASGRLIGPELGLKSPFLVPLHVQRLVAGTSFSAGTFNPVYVGTTPVKIRDTKGFEVVKDYTPARDIFDNARRAWTFNRVLQPNEGFTLYSQTNQMPACLIGWREEQYS